MPSQTPKRLPLDPTLYNLQDDELAFFKAQTGIHNDQELKEHILGVQEEAYAVHPYPCIRRLAFTTLKISRYPAYDAVLKIVIENPKAILLDLGCCFGNDARKVIADGYPLENVVASDIHPEFWTLGHQLFRSSQESFPVQFVPGDIFDPEFLEPDTLRAPSSSLPPTPIPPLRSVTSLTQLQHHISVIHTSAFFHLFSRTQQHELAHLLVSLLSPLPGSMIFGSHMGVVDTEENKEGGTRLTGRGVDAFAHSPSSWEKLWAGEGGVFKPGDVILSTEAVEVERKDIIQAGGDPTYKAHLLVWSVTKV